MPKHDNRLKMLRSSINSSFMGQKRLLSIDSIKCALNEAASLKKQDYYKHMAEAQGEDNVKPAGWDEAKPFESIPGPKPIPILGNTFRFFPKVGEYHGLDLVEFTTKLFEEYGEIVLMRQLGGKNKHLLSLFSPEYIEILFRNDGIWPNRMGLEGFDYYRRVIRKDVFGGVIGTVTSQGKDWFNFRSAVNPILMQPRTMYWYVGKIDGIASEFVENMKTFAQNSSVSEMPEDFQNELNKFALESIGVTALDTRLGCLVRNLEPDSDVQKFINAVYEFFDLMYKVEVLPHPWRYFSTPTWKRYVSTMDYLYSSALKYIERANLHAEVEGKDDKDLSLIQRLLKIDKKIAISMSIDMLQAGVDTTGKTAASILYFLAKNVDVQNKLREEIMRLLPSPDTPITKEVLQESLYVKAVIKEAQRMAPITTGTARVLSKDVVIGGYQVPKGTEVSTANLIISRLEKYFPRANEFIPERWLRTTTDELSHKNVHPFVSLPFGFGARSCVGKRIALMELEVIITKIIRNFELSWHHEDMIFKTVLLHGVGKPLKIRVKEIKQ